MTHWVCCSSQQSKERTGGTPRAGCVDQLLARSQAHHPPSASGLSTGLWPFPMPSWSGYMMKWENSSSGATLRVSSVVGSYKFCALPSSDSTFLISLPLPLQAGGIKTCIIKTKSPRGTWLMFCVARISPSPLQEETVIQNTVRSCSMTFCT